MTTQLKASITSDELTPVLAKLETEAEVAEHERARHELLTAKWKGRDVELPQRSAIVERALDVNVRIDDVLRSLRALEKRLEPVLGSPVVPDKSEPVPPETPHGPLKAQVLVQLDGALSRLSRIDEAIVQIQARLQL